MNRLDLYHLIKPSSSSKNRRIRCVAMHSHSSLFTNGLSPCSRTYSMLTNILILGRETIFWERPLRKALAGRNLLRNTIWRPINLISATFLILGITKVLRDIKWLIKESFDTFNAWKPFISGSQQINIRMCSLPNLFLVFRWTPLPLQCSTRHRCRVMLL